MTSELEQLRQAHDSLLDCLDDETDGAYYGDRNDVHEHHVEDDVDDHAVADADDSIDYTHDDSDSDSEDYDDEW